MTWFGLAKNREPYHQRRRQQRTSHSRFFKRYRVSVPVCWKRPNVGILATSRPLGERSDPFGPRSGRATKSREVFVSGPIKSDKGRLECRQISLEMISWGSHSSFNRKWRTKNCRRLVTPSMNREIRHFFSEETVKAKCDASTDPFWRFRSFSLANVTVWRLVTSVGNKMAADSSTKRCLSFSSFSWEISVLRRYF